MGNTVVSAQVSLYPLRQAHLGASVDAFQSVLEEAGLALTPGPMSTLVEGDTTTLFRALEHAFTRAAENGAVVLTVTVSNTCPR